MSDNEGWIRLNDNPHEVYVKGDQVVITGTPATYPDDDDPRAHNCDDMGCGSAGPHVILRATRRP